MTTFIVSKERILHEYSKLKPEGTGYTFDWYVQEGFLYIYIIKGSTTYYYWTQSNQVPESLRSLLRPQDMILGVKEADVPEPAPEVHEEAKEVVERIQDGTE
jgi:hypothetical protein|tara:strand:- start:168 stop:473 length:306 start_codon:yes stop_codon:yes gene_type:complete